MLNQQALGKHTNCILPRFNKVIFQYHHVIQKNVSSTETQQRSLRGVLHFTRQNLILASPPND